MLFVSDVSEEDIKHERNAARVFRQSAWWKNKLSRGRCYYCGAQLPPKELTMDHIVPIIRGGRTVKSNVVTACKGCNNRKKNLLPIEWDEYLSSL
jgi:5-methylcytosine-specific restriction endonuclease McrA